MIHAKFGAGVIVSAEGRGADARVQVNFQRRGLKWLMLEYAKLAPRNALARAMFSAVFNVQSQSWRFQRFIQH